MTIKANVRQSGLKRLVNSLEFLRIRINNSAARSPHIVSFLPPIPARMVLPNLARKMSMNANLVKVSAGKNPDMPNMPRMIRQASVHPLARKKTNARFTKLNVINQASGLGILILRFFQLWLTTRAPPCMHPQMINVQPAPCQKPEINMAMKIAYMDRTKVIEENDLRIGVYR